jgi:putative molybdopterin biosynthesis protein
MSIYLQDIPLPEAQARFAEALQIAGCWGPLESQTIPLDENALDRVLSEPVWAKISSPHYHAAAMDGFAVRAEQTVGAMESQPLVLRYGEQAVYVDTGDPMPASTNAVIPIENIEPLDDQERLSAEIRHPYAIRIRTSVPPWRYVRPMGEDIVATQLVLPAGQLVRPVDLGAVAACGHTHLKVIRRPRVAILPTGSELVPVGTQVEPGDIIEYNSIILAAQVNSWGGEAVRFPIIPDNFELIQAKVREAASQFDLVLLNAGSSAGSEDFSARVVESVGKLLVHGVAIRPGHPVILGMLDRSGSSEGATSTQVPVIGVPGYPVSATLTGEIFVKPLLSRWLGRSDPEPLTIKAKLTRKVTSPPGDDDYLRVILGRIGNRVLAAPLSRGAGVITSLVQADGIVILPRGLQGLPAGEQVDVRLIRAVDELDRTIFTIGSHDIALDVLAQYLATYQRRLVSSNVGSLGGLHALQQGEAHLAGSHLLDPESGEYNLPYIRQYLPGIPVVVVALVGRQQGLLVAHGNPLKINSLKDLQRPDVSFINRQRGAGTRVLLDYQLGLSGIPHEAIRGYTQEEYTHLAVAAAVASGRASCGLGIAAAAQALDLGYVPLFEERYDLIMPVVHYESDLIAPLLLVIKSAEFKKAVASLPGYDTSRMGEVIDKTD